jgi:hypothetical protein
MSQIWGTVPTTQPWCLQYVVCWSCKQCWCYHSHSKKNVCDKKCLCGRKTASGVIIMTVYVRYGEPDIIFGVGTSYVVHKVHASREGFCVTYAQHMSNNINRNVSIISSCKWGTCSWSMLVLRDLSLLQQCFWRFESSGTWCCPVGWEVPDASQHCTAFTFSPLSLFGTEDEPSKCQKLLSQQQSITGKRTRISFVDVN